MRADEFRGVVARAKTGDESAVTTLYRLLQPRLVRYLSVLAPSDEQRLAAETWVEVVAQLDRFDGDEHAWYALGLATARRRADARDGGSAPIAREAPPEGEDARAEDDDGMAGFGVRSALAAVARLPRDQAEVVLLRVLGELSVEEVADLLDRPAGSVRGLQTQALRTLHWLVSPEEAVS